jgi:hypothetical protein
MERFSFLVLFTAKQLDRKNGRDMFLKERVPCDQILLYSV